MKKEDLSKTIYCVQKQILLDILNSFLILIPLGPKYSPQESI